MIKASNYSFVKDRPFRVCENEKLLKPEQTALKLEPVNKSGCSKENELAAFPISSLWRGFRFYILKTIQVQVLVFFRNGDCESTQEDNVVKVLFSC